MALTTFRTSNASAFRLAGTRRWIVPVAVFGALVILAIAVDPNVPSWMDIGLQKWVRDRYMWTVQNSNTSWIFTRVFNPLADAIDWAVESVQWILRTLRWPGVLALTGGIGWMTGGLRAAVSGAAAMAGVAVLGVWEPAMVTLSIMLTAVAIALVIGVPLGIWTSRSDRAERILRTFLDTAQVMPVFVYFSPVTILFGIQYPPAVVATVIYAVPPAVRLTSLGLRSVPTVMNEVGESFGCTSRQQLLKVQLPMARKTILLGLNQVIMMAFGIVVIASLLGADDLGNLVLKGLQKNDVGAAFVPGLAIVLLAVSLDRISTGERSTSTKPPLVRLPTVDHRTGSLIALGLVAVAAVVAKVADISEVPVGAHRGHQRNDQRRGRLGAGQLPRRGAGDRRHPGHQRLPGDRRARTSAEVPRVAPVGAGRRRDRRHCLPQQGMAARCGVCDLPAGHRHDGRHPRRRRRSHAPVGPLDGHPEPGARRHPHQRGDRAAARCARRTVRPSTAGHAPVPRHRSGAARSSCTSSPCCSCSVSAAAPA